MQQLHESSDELANALFRCPWTMMVSWWGPTHRSQKQTDGLQSRDSDKRVWLLRLGTEAGFRGRPPEWQHQYVHKLCWLEHDKYGYWQVVLRTHPGSFWSAHHSLFKLWRGMWDDLWTPEGSRSQRSMRSRGRVRPDMKHSQCFSPSAVNWQGRSAVPVQNSRSAMRLKSCCQISGFNSTILALFDPLILSAWSQWRRLSRQAQYKLQSMPASQSSNPLIFF